MFNKKLKEEIESLKIQLHDKSCLVEKMMLDREFIQGEVRYQTDRANKNFHIAEKIFDDYCENGIIMDTFDDYLRNVQKEDLLRKKKERK